MSFRILHKCDYKDSSFELIKQEKVKQKIVLLTNKNI